jgi:hypothetical protein
MNKQARNKIKSNLETLAERQLEREENRFKHNEWRIGEDKKLEKREKKLADVIDISTSQKIDVEAEIQANKRVEIFKLLGIN